MTTRKRHLAEALRILADLGMPKAQQNERSALTLLALAGLRPEHEWRDASAPLMGITPIMEWAKTHYRKAYAPNTRETVRRQTMHQLVAAGLALYNPDAPKRPVNSPKAVYQIAPDALELVRRFGREDWQAALASYLAVRPTLTEQYAAARLQHRVPVATADGKAIELTPGAHSELIRAVIEDFAPRFAPGSKLVYVGDTGSKWGYFDDALLRDLGVTIDEHGKMPDVVLWYAEANWLLLVESVTSHGPVDSKRHRELWKLFESAKPGLVFVTTFPDRRTMGRYLADLAWETEVWIAEDPSHMIHFNGSRFLGPHEAS